MNYLKQGGKIGIFFIACAITFGFSSSVVFSAAPTTEAECKALPGGNCQKEGAVYNCESGETEYGSCGGANPVCCVTKETCGSNNQGACRYTIAGGCKSDESVLTNCSTNWSGQERKCCVPNTSGTPNSDTSCTSSCNGATCKARKAISTVGSTPCPTGFKENGTCNSKNSGEQVCCIPSSCTPSTTSSTTSSGSGSTSSSGSASLKYTPLENLPGFENQGGDFATYFGNLYKLALWIVGISALFMLVVGGFLYLSSAGNTALLGTAKKTIYSALIGLVIALVSWLLLDTINSDLTNLKLSGLSGAISSGSSSGTGSSASAGTGSGGSTATGTYTHAEAAAALSAAGIGITSSSGRIGCSDVGCTTLEGIPKSAIDNLISIKKDCGCSFNVTGGTEAGHASHGSGKPIVDVTQDTTLGNFLYSKAGGSGGATITKSPGYGISKICVTTAWEKLNFGCGSYRESAAHFHLVF